MVAKLMLWLQIGRVAHLASPTFYPTSLGPKAYKIYLGIVLRMTNLIE